MNYDNGNNNVQDLYLERKALKVAKEEFALGRFAAKKTQPKKNGKRFVVSYFEHLPETAIQTLAEGVAPDPTDLVRVNKTGALVRQGGYIPYSDEAKEMYDIEFESACVEELSYGVGTKLDKDAFSTLLNDSGNVIDVTAVGG